MKAIIRRGTKGEVTVPWHAAMVVVIAVLAVGDTLPALRGRDLTGHGVRLPDATRGRVTLLSMGFTYESRFPVEAWTNRFRADFGADRRVNFYEVPLIGGMGKLARGFIDGGMRKSTPKELQDNVVTVYDEVSDWKKRMADPGGDVAHVVLLDAKGRVVARHTGAFDEAAYQRVADATRRVLAE
jgi:hypothetical protein